MLLWTWHQRRRDVLKPVLRIEDVLMWALMGLWFGTITAFHWRRAFHMPLVLITAGLFASACLVPIAVRLARKSRQ